MKRFEPLIKAMPVQEQAFTIKKSNWAKHMNGDNKISKILSELFNDDKTILISRADLFKMAKSNNIKKFIVATILWGYPRGMRGNHFETITDDFKILEETLEEVRGGIKDWSKHYLIINKIKGLGLSTYSKFLYFLDVKVNKEKALILDIRIINVLQSAPFDELSSLKGISYTTAVKRYPDYLEHMNKLAHQFKVESGKLEMFIFEFGLNLKVD